MLRHPCNKNLHYYYDANFEGLPVMWEKGPLIREYLERLKKTIDLALEEYPRLMAFRVDLRYPEGFLLPSEIYLNKTLTEFFKSFRAKIDHNRDCARKRNPYAHDCIIRYVWAREFGLVGRPHYHILILLNRDAFYTVGRLGSESSNIVNRIREAWANALGLTVDEVGGLVHIPKRAKYNLDRVASGVPTELPELFHRASYLCKSVTKIYGDRTRCFDTSRG